MERREEQCEDRDRLTFVNVSYATLVMKHYKRSLVNVIRHFSSSMLLIEEGYTDGQIYQLMWELATPAVDRREHNLVILH